MDTDPVVDVSSDESISNLPLINFYSPPTTASKSSKRTKESPPAASSEPYSGRRLRSSTKPFRRVQLKKKYNEKAKKSKKKGSPPEKQPEISTETGDGVAESVMGCDNEGEEFTKEPETAKEVVTKKVKPKVHPSKAITVLEEVIITSNIKLNKGQLKLFIDVDPELEARWYLSGLGAEATRAGMRVRPATALRGTALLLWATAGASTLTSVHGTVELTPPEVRCSHGLYVCEMEEVAQKVTDQTLVTHMKSLESIACCKLSLVMFGYKEFFKASCKRHRLVSEFDIETAIADLIVSINCDTIVINEPSELVMTLVQYHKGFTSYYKKDTCIEEDQADFYMKGFNKKCIGVDKDGMGLARLWQQMMAILPKSSLETARALCARMRSPRELYEALTTPMGLETVSGVAVSRAGGPHTRTRRVGPELARKLKILFTEEDGSTIVM